MNTYSYFKQTGLMIGLVIAFALHEPGRIHAQQPLVPLVTSDFASGPDGWIAQNTAGHAKALDYNTEGSVSNSVGHITTGENNGDGDTIYLCAPPKFTGDLRAAYNGLLQFQLRQEQTSNLYQAWDILIRSTNMTLGYRLPKIPGTNWMVCELPLNEHVGLIRPGIGQLATRGEVIATLSAVTSIWIRAEYSQNNTDRCHLDEVRLLGQPAGPPTPMLALATYAGIQIEGVVGRTYRIDYRANLGPTEAWLTLTNAVLSVSPQLFIDSSSSSASARFYRASLID